MNSKFLFVVALVLAIAFSLPTQRDGEKDKKPDFPNGNDRACRGPTYAPCNTSCAEIGYSDGVCKALVTFFHDDKYQYYYIKRRYLKAKKKNYNRQFYSIFISL
uniref:Secreted protein n=1 Tax=Bursaphelenchus xylophilus TaxID=6326 RepID=A0A1I7SBL8_BURXY